ncbi:hypothetical protein LQZ18_14270 [Lachnospiraceae bacterium ZAX-1]
MKGNEAARRQKKNRMIQRRMELMLDETSRQSMVLQVQMLFGKSVKNILLNK